MPLDLEQALRQLTCERTILRSAGFHHVLSMVWEESKKISGRGIIHKHAVEAVPRLISLLQQVGTPDKHSIVFLLGLLSEADASTASADLPKVTRELIKAGLASYLNLLGEVKDKSTTSGVRLLNALLYLIAHFDEDSDKIMQRMIELFGSGSEEYSRVAHVFELSKNAPRLSRMLLAAMGAEVCSSVGPDQLDRCAKLLVCPRCRGCLRFGAARILCAICNASYSYLGDIIDLVDPKLDEPDEFPAEFVKIYEVGSRPRFVRVMANDWEGHVTVAREEKYLQRHLLPVEGAVLDLACGAGSWTKLVARLVGAHRLIALDYSHPMLAASQEVVPDALFVRGSASQLPIGTEVLGGANCSNALQALPDAGKAIQEIGRCLRQGAPFTCFTFRAATDKYRYFQNRFPFNPRPVFSEEQIVSFSESAGLEVTNIGGVNQALFFTARKRHRRTS
jgi:SAM-dependent methyltransferase